MKLITATTTYQRLQGCVWHIQWNWRLIKGRFLNWSSKPRLLGYSWEHSKGLSTNHFFWTWRKKDWRQAGEAECILYGCISTSKPKRGGWSQVHHLCAVERDSNSGATNADYTKSSLNVIDRVFGLTWNDVKQKQFKQFSHRLTDINKS